LVAQLGTERDDPAVMQQPIASFPFSLVVEHRRCIAYPANRARAYFAFYEKLASCLN
jgi:hypothetical protein